MNSETFYCVSLFNFVILFVICFLHYQYLIPTSILLFDVTKMSGLFLLCFFILLFCNYSLLFLLERAFLFCVIIIIAILCSCFCSMHTTPNEYCNPLRQEQKLSIFIMKP